ncbi:unnamed protein product [Lactuca virosa]|uniref:Uncharacterized protein n=1 Tax=Lactuca virosa TaxID=75947 RepID=A0AAU9LWE7_9ASTR|nr:unnamed protein product [Lactuca virosa]
MNPFNKEQITGGTANTAIYYRGCCNFLFSIQQRVFWSAYPMTMIYRVPLGQSHGFLVISLGEEKRLNLIQFARIKYPIACSFEEF